MLAPRVARTRQGIRCAAHTPENHANAEGNAGLTESAGNGSDCYQWSVLGVPVPKGRPRATKTGRIYTPAKTKRAEEWQRAASAAHAPPQPIAGEVYLGLAFVFEPPKSWSKRKKAQALRGELPHTKRPDLDNLIKLAVDSQNGLCWADDTQITRVTASKRYGPQAMTRYTVKTRGSMDGNEAGQAPPQ